ncbi:MAG: L,D-transpeptidase [Spiribacter sp.]|nr:L,D-transpeptidase [Spiribacter sp.]MDR9489251.1 L,D-transpeptidase [Spiribacter sp.]
MNQSSWIKVSLTEQTLSLMRDRSQYQSWPCSTASVGASEQFGSGGTPRGWHRVRLLIGSDMPEGAVFVGRRPTGERYSQTLARAYPQRDWILSRIVWLTGQQSGINRGGRVDTLRRFIYIHGTPESEPMGVAKSHGCIRMRNADVIALFACCYPGMQVLVEEDPTCSGH